MYVCMFRTFDIKSVSQEKTVVAKNGLLTIGYAFNVDVDSTETNLMTPSFFYVKA